MLDHQYACLDVIVTRVCALMYGYGCSIREKKRKEVDTDFNSFIGDRSWVCPLILSCVSPSTCKSLVQASPAVRLGI